MAIPDCGNPWPGTRESPDDHSLLSFMVGSANTIIWLVHLEGVLHGDLHILLKLLVSDEGRCRLTTLRDLGWGSAAGRASAGTRGARENKGIDPGCPRRVAIGASCVAGRQGGEHVGENHGGVCTRGYAYPLLCDTVYIAHDGLY